MPWWVAQLSPDIEESRQFYAAIFGWSFDNIAPPGGPPFYVASLHGDRVAGLAAPQEPAVWIMAVAVHDFEESLRIAVRAGGTAPGESIDIPTLGHFHRLHDPAGAEVHVVRPLEATMSVRGYVPGAWSTSLLGVGDPPSVVQFYASLFGWQADDSGPVTLLRLPGYVGGEPHQSRPRDVVAVMEQTSGAAEAAWIPDFRVADVDAVAETAIARGGCVIAEPAATDRDSHTAALIDPGGAKFTVSQRQGGDVAGTA